MRSVSLSVLALSGALFVSSVFAAPLLAQAMAANAAHVEMGYVAVGFREAPEGKGLLQTATAEANVAIQHAGFAAAKPKDLDYAKFHMAHVRHAIDPSIDGEGPGLGFGFKPASMHVVKHTENAIKADGASDNVKLHGDHVAASARNGVARADEILRLIEMIMDAKSAVEAEPLVLRVHDLSRQLLDGFDANGDGQVTWKTGEGGLNVAAKHVIFLFEGEDLEKPSL